MKDVKKLFIDTKLYTNPDVISVLEQLIQNYPVAGKQIHDANIVATMKVYGIKYLLTNNISDFARFDQLINLIPL
jgi:predicted nucleic acid-binding protein